MKKAFVVLALGILVAGSAVAQQAPKKERSHHTEQRDGKDRKGNRTPEERATLRTEKMSQELGLNKSQTRKLQALHLKQMQEREAMRAHHNEGEKRDRNQRREMKASREKWDAELKDILTKKQYAKYQEQRKEMRVQHQERKGHDGHRNRQNRQHQQERS
ncbi:DUF4890 domain-containing protein [Pontibacter saemangeumensis]|uniref:DUF4890 domain-containing protein n=1 Tax=Pontibacter saemangeumensis TaxID=1084525 RepID=A0ABP8LCU4_9BACT